MQYHYAASVYSHNYLSEVDPYPQPNDRQKKDEEAASYI